MWRQAKRGVGAMHGLFGMDFLISNMIATFTLVLLFTGFFLILNSYTGQMGGIYREKKALEISDHLINNCKENLGIALCDENFISRNVFSSDDVGAVMGAYYKNPLEIFEAAKKNSKPSDIVAFKV